MKHQKTHKRNFKVKNILKKKDKKKEEDEKVTSNSVKIEIYSKISEDLMGLKAEFFAIENNDKDTNRVTTNEDKFFKENLAFSRDVTLDALEYTLEIEQKSKKEKLVILDKKIKEQKELIRKFEQEPKDGEENINAKYNYENEYLKLRQLNVIRDGLKKAKRGAYMRLKNGIKTFEFVGVDGVLYPYFFGGNFYRAYPDFEIKKKIYNREQTLLDQQMKVGKEGMMNWIYIFATVLVVSIMLNVGFGYFLWDSSQDRNMEINQAGINCNNAMASISNTYGDVVTEYFELKAREMESIKSNQNPNNNIDNSISITPK